LIVYAFFKTMNRILAICHSLNPEGLNGVNVFLRSLAQTFTMERFASIHILHGPAISRKDFPADIQILLYDSKINQFYL